MVAFARQSLNRLFAQSRLVPLAGGVLGGGAVAAGFLLIPVWRLEDLVWNTGIAALIPVAAPPLGITARAILALGGGVMAAAVLWSTLFLLFGSGGFLVTPKRRADGMPKVRRADAHPDAPPRRPLSAAADLGAPMPPVERSIPVDLDIPLAAFDPKALRPVPMEATRTVAPLTPPPVASERIETFALTPPLPSPPESTAERAPEPAPQPASPPPAEPASKPSIEALLRRLEASAGRAPVAGPPISQPVSPAPTAIPESPESPVFYDGRLIPPLRK